MAGIPAALWLGFFYLQDRHEPEPKHFVAGVCVLGALVAAPLSDVHPRPGVAGDRDGAAGPSEWSLDRVLHAVAVVGLTQELCKYAVVRYTIYMSREFDEPMDGVVYMTAAAPASRSGQLPPPPGPRSRGVPVRRRGQGGDHDAGARVVRGRPRLRDGAGAVHAPGRARARHVLILLGLCGAAVLNGQFALMESWIQESGLGGSEQWKGVGYAAAVAAAVFGVLMFASRRLLRDSPFRRRPGP